MVRSVGVAALVLPALLLAGCEDTGAEPSGSPASRTSAAASVAAETCDLAPAGDVAADSVLVPGPGNGVPRSKAPGESLVIVGLVVDSRCRPAAAATVTLHHTDSRGSYGPSEGECCYYQGSVQTDDDGRFRLETIRPGQYAEGNAPPAHIHLQLRHDTGGLNTEIVFVGDPGVPTVPVDGYAPVELRDEGGSEAPSWYGEVVLVLGSAG